MSAFTEPLTALFEAYIAKTEQLERDRKPGDGLLGMKPGPKDDPCHERFAAEAEALLKDMAERCPGPAEAREALEYIYRAPLEHRHPQTAYWMLQAVHSLTPPLAARLDPEGAQALWEQYRKDYRRWERLPAHKAALAALDAARKGK